MKATIVPGVSYWSCYQPDRRIDFQGWFWTAPDGNALIDPMPMSADRIEVARDAGGAAWIVLTNHDHVRATADLKARFDARVAAPRGDRERFGDAAGIVDCWFAADADLPAELAPHLAVHEIRGGKSPVEVALWLRAASALLFGDVVRSHVSGRLQLLPDDKLADARQLARDLRELPGEPAAVLLGDGDPILLGAAAEWRRFIATLPE